jgi:hypothetical protein
MEYDYAKSNVGDSGSYAFRSVWADVRFLAAPSGWRQHAPGLPRRNVVQHKDSTAAVGLQYDEWTIDNTIHYEARGGVYYPSRITYQYYEKRSSYDKFATSKTKKRVEYFASKEATLTLHDTTRTPGPRYYDIPHEIHSAIIYIESRRHSRNSIAVSKMPREYQKLKE